MRIFSARVDIALYLAPFLDRKGFAGALSKRMDGVILSACVRRSAPAPLCGTPSWSCGDRTRP